MTPTEKRIDESSAMVIASKDARAGSSVARRSGRCGPAGLRAGVGAHDDGAVLDLEHEAAVAARIDERGPAEPAHRAEHRQVETVLVAADGARRIDQAVAPTVRQPGREDRFTVRAGLRDP